MPPAQTAARAPCSNRPPSCGNETSLRIPWNLLCGPEFPCCRIYTELWQLAQGGRVLAGAGRSDWCLVPGAWRLDLVGRRRRVYELEPDDRHRLVVGEAPAGLAQQHRGLVAAAVVEAALVGA